jgi:hypothetical protein
LNEDELLRIEQELRNVILGSHLEWILDEIDAAVAAGVPEEKVLQRRSRRRGAGTSPQHGRLDVPYITVQMNVAERDREALEKNGALVITTRPMTTRERVELMNTALQRVLVELPMIEEETLKILHNPSEEERGSRTPVTRIRFVPDEEINRRSERESELSVRQSEEEQSQLRLLFTEVSAEVGSEQD